MHTGTPNTTILAEAGRNPQRAFAAQMLLRYWNRLVHMEDGCLAKRAFLVSAALARTTLGRSRLKYSAGQASAVLESPALPCNLAAPAVVDADKRVSSLQPAHLSSATDSELVSSSNTCA